MTDSPGSPVEPTPDASRNSDAELVRMRRIRRLAVALFETQNQTEIVELALTACLELLRGESASFWAGGEDGFTCQLALGPASESLTGRTSSGETLLAADPAGRSVTAPVAVGEVVLGALRVSRRSAAEVAPFSDGDSVALQEVAESVAAALLAAVNAQPAEAGRGLALVLEMSREIGSSLDLDRVLRSVVNLAAQAVSFDRGAVALYEAGKCDIRAVAGADRVDPTTPEMQDVAVRAEWAVGVGQRFYLPDRTDPTSDAERIFLQIFGEDLERGEVGSGLYLPLADDEGAIGILVFEAERPDFASEEDLELLTILANQTAVAIRNAQLYARVPLADTLVGLSARRRQLLALPRRRQALAGMVAVAAIAILTLIQWPFRVPAIAPILRPTERAEVRAVVGGVLEEVLVREGTAVDRGVPIARLRDAEVRAERDATALEIRAAEQAAAQAAARRDPLEERLQRLRVESLKSELAVEEQTLALLTLRSPVRGLVLTPRPEERIDAKLDAGETLVSIGRVDSLELEFGVDQRDVSRVEPGAEVRLRVDAYPQRTFVGRVSVIGQASVAEAAQPVFPIRAIVPNAEGALRPGMVAQARVLTAPMSILGRLVRTPLRTLRLFWWRLWSWS